VGADPVLLVLLLGRMPAGAPTVGTPGPPAVLRLVHPRVRPGGGGACRLASARTQTLRSD